MGRLGTLYDEAAEALRRGDRRLALDTLRAATRELASLAGECASSGTRARRGPAGFPRLRRRVANPAMARREAAGARARLEALSAEVAGELARTKESREQLRQRRRLRESFSGRVHPGGRWVNRRV